MAKKHPEAAPKAEVARNASDVVLTAYDNEADEGATCVCTLTFADGGTATGSAPRTDSLAADQLAARTQALGG